MKISGLTHVYREDLMLPAWIEWHKQFFDFCTIIDDCPDQSARKFEHLLPEGWEIIPTRRIEFDCFQLDQEVMDVEKSLKERFNCDWHLTLNVTEWVFNKDLKEQLEKLDIKHQESAQKAFGLTSVILTQPEEDIAQVPDPQLYTWGFIDNNYTVRRPRFIHNQEHGCYALGRHSTYIPNLARTDLHLLYWAYAPWPACKERKLQIQTRIPQAHKDLKLGFEHNITEEELTLRRLEFLKKSGNLLEDPIYKGLYGQFS